MAVWGAAVLGSSCQGRIECEESGIGINDPRDRSPDQIRCDAAEDHSIPAERKDRMTVLHSRHGADQWQPRGTGTERTGPRELCFRIQVINSFPWSIIV